MNTVAPITTTVNTATNLDTKQLLKELRTIAYRWGFDSYIAGQRLEDMQTEDMRRGWWAALDADAACATGYAVKAGW